MKLVGKQSVKFKAEIIDFASQIPWKNLDII